MKMLILLSLFTTVAMSCGDNAYRCVGPSRNAAEDFRHTQLCLKSVGLDENDTCYCWGSAQDYGDVGSDKAEAFRACCEGYDNYSVRECSG